jgi:hypothetical protein
MNVDNQLSYDTHMSVQSHNSFESNNSFEYNNSIDYNSKHYKSNACSDKKSYFWICVRFIDLPININLQSILSFLNDKSFLKKHSLNGNFDIDHFSYEDDKDYKDDENNSIQILYSAHCYLIFDNLFPEKSRDFIAWKILNGLKFTFKYLTTDEWGLTCKPTWKMQLDESIDTFVNQFWFNNLSKHNFNQITPIDWIVLEDKSIIDNTKVPNTILHSMNELINKNKFLEEENTKYQKLYNDNLEKYKLWMQKDTETIRDLHQKIKNLEKIIKTLNYEKNNSTENTEDTINKGNHRYHFRPSF